MTQEEKAKAYDEALERMKSWAKGEHPECFTEAQKAAEFIFPELAESEDERIRKVLIDYFKSYREVDTCGAETFNGIPTDNILAWLEKQKEFVSADFDDVWDTADCDELTAPLEKYSKDAIKKMCHAWYDKGIELERRNWLEKHGEQNDSDVKDYNSIDPHFGKSIDKIEPKFHKGDWIVHHGTGNIYQVVAVIDNQYQLKYGDTYTIQNCADVDRCARLWDVTKDAKDGDVLAYVTDEEDLWIMIYWSLYEPYEGHVHYHALLVNDNFSDKGTCCICINDLKPATKEQRELLFQKMKEAGWECDADKKELKRLENQTLKSKWTDDDEQYLLVCKNALRKYQVSDKWDADIISKWLDDKLKQGEQKPAWSEEDELIALSIEHVMNCASLLNIVPEKVDKIRTWIKSLKQRMEGKV